jgi:hypothetical protein
MCTEAWRDCDFVHFRLGKVRLNVRYSDFAVCLWVQGICTVLKYDENLTLFNFG